MKKHMTFYSMLLIVLFAGCIKNNNSEDNTLTIKGRLMQDCSLSPKANQEISFFQSISNILPNSGGQLGSTTTDANGNFSFTYKPQGTLDIKIQTPAGLGYNTVMEFVPATKDVDNLQVFYGASSVFQIRLNVARPYTSTDTLYVNDNRRGMASFKKAGPFTNGLVHTIPDYFFQPTYGSTTGVLSYRIGTSGTWVNKEYSLVACDTSRVSLDIN